MQKRWLIVLFILLSVSVSNAVEKADMISDREVVERLTRVETKLAVKSGWMTKKSVKGETAVDALRTVLGSGVEFAPRVEAIWQS